MKEKSKKIGKDIEIAFLPLTFKHKKYVQNFHSGNDEIDRYFQNFAIDDWDTATYAFVDKSLDIAIAFVSMSCSRVDYWQDKEYIDSTPAVEIKYFAVDERYHSLPYESKNDKLTLSKVIMSKTICYIFDEIVAKIGASKIILSSVPKAVNFYKGCYFEVYENNMEINYDCVDYNLIPMYYNLKPDI